MPRISTIDIPAVSFYRYQELLAIQDLNQITILPMLYDATQNDCIRLPAAVFDNGLVVRVVLRSNSDQYRIMLEPVNEGFTISAPIELGTKLNEELTFVYRDEVYRIRFNLMQAKQEKKDTTEIIRYQNPIPSVDDEPQSNRVTITFKFDMPATKEEAARAITDFIATHGLTPNMIHLVGSVSMRYALPQPCGYERPFEKETT